MKISKFLPGLTIVFMALLSSCGKTENPPRPALVLSSDVASIMADGTDAATLTVKYGGEDVTSKATIKLAGTAIEGNTFTTTQAGEYIFTAEYEGKTSNEKIVTATFPDVEPKLILSHSATTRARGTTFKLGAAGTSDAITWASSNTAVATVDATTGVVSALTSGTSTITATAGTLTAECALSVEVSCATDSNLGSGGVGTASFISDKTWKVAGMEWSDGVTATGCQKSTYLGDPTTGAYRSDCRSNPGYGDLFSWCAIIRYQDVLCPDGWRIPTKEEFVALDKEFGFIGGYSEPEWSKVEATYLNADKWGGALGGYCLDKDTMGYPAGTLLGQNGSAAYWASNENKDGKGNGFCLYLSKGGDFPPVIDINYMSMFDQGQSLRCVKTF